MDDAGSSPRAEVLMRDVTTCTCCGLTQRVPDAPDRARVQCARCDTRLHRPGRAGDNALAAAIALAALIIYPLAVTLPMLEIEQFGHRNASSILGGTITLLSSGHLFVGIVVLLCSVILPLTKLISLLALASGASGLADHHRALTYRLVEWTGRWGMLDVLLVAVLVAVLKLGDLVEVSAGPAALAFTVCVLLSLLATAAFDPHALWSAQEEPSA